MVSIRSAGVGLFGSLPALLGAAPTVYWLDSAELAGAAVSLGIAHPPGHPFVALLGKAASLIPIGSLAFRQNVLQALCLGVAAMALYTIARSIAAGASAATAPAAGLVAGAASVSGSGAATTALPWHLDLLAAAAALLVVWSPGAVLQGMRAEVYALHLALIAGAAAALIRGRGHRSPRGTAMAALLLGLALANHHLLALAATPALLLLAWPGSGRGQEANIRRSGSPRRGATARAMGLGGLFLAAGLATYAYLPIRAARRPAFQWGFPDTLSGLIDVVTARAFQKSVSLGDATASLGDRLAGIAAHLGSELAFAGALLGLLGLALLLLRAPQRRTGAALLLLAAGTMSAQAIVGFDPANPDAAGYLLPAVAALAMAVPAALGALHAAAATRLRGERRRALGAIAGVGALIALAQLPGAALVSLGSVWDARTTCTAIERAVPNGGTLVLSSFRLVFPMQWFLAVEGWRPDLLFLQRKYYFDGQRALYATRDPRVGAMLGDFARDSGDLHPQILRFLAVRRAVLVEPDIWADPILLGPGAPAGLVIRLGAPAGGAARDAAGGAGSIAAQEAFWNTLYPALGGPSDPETLRTLLWTHYELSRWAFAAGYPALGSSELRRALSIAPDDPDLRAFSGSPKAAP